MSQSSRATRANPVVIPGVELLEAVGQGARSLVYLGRRGERDFAVKIPRSAESEITSEVAREFHREAAVLARLKNPALPEVYEVGTSEEGLPYLIMEYVRGRTLAEELRKGPLSEEIIVRIASLLAQALEEVHRLGLVHRDLKPQNVILTEASSVKLIDFGFSADQVSAELAAAERLAGTFLYSAPENSGVLKRPVDGRSDLYSLGVVLYECATGAPPFRAADVGELVHQHLTLAPADPRILNPKISPALSSVILKLLAKDPDDRYQSGRGLRSDLTRLPELVKLDTGSELLEKTPLFGREREMALLAGCLESHHGSIALIEGEPGSGKSRIVQEIQRSARQKGALILAGKASKSDPMPLSALRDSVERAAARSESAAQVFREAGRNSASLLKRFAPALFADAPDFPIGADQDQFFAAIAGFFRHLGSAQSPVVLALDDVQWLDEASLGIIRRIADGTLQNTSLLILCTGRSDPASREGLEKFVSSAGNALSQRIPLGALSEDAASRLIAAHLGGNPVDASFARQLVSRTQGSPFAIGEYLRAVFEAGLLTPHWGSWQVDSSGLESLKLPTDVLQLVTRRIGNLSAEARDILIDAAFLGSRFSLELLPRICGVARELVNASIAEAMRANLVELSPDDQVMFVHDRVHEALVAGLSEDECGQRHQKIAEALDGGDPTPERVYALARHYGSGTIAKNPKRAFEAEFLAGRLALETFLYEDAYRFLTKAREISDDPRLEAPLGKACERTGKLEEAKEHLRNALKREPDSRQRARIRAQLIDVHLGAWEVLEADEEVRRAFAELGRPLPRSNLLFAITSLGLWLAGVTLGRLRFGTARGRRAELYRIQGRLNMSLMILCYYKNDLARFVFSLPRMLYPARLLGPSTELADSYVGMANLTAILKLPKQARRYSDLAVQTAADTGNRFALAQAMVFRAFVASVGGDPVETLQLLNEALDRGGQWLDTLGFVNAVGPGTQICLLRGHFKRAFEWVELGFQRMRLAAGSGKLLDSHVNSVVEFYLLSTQGRHSEAQKGFDRYKEVLRGRPHDVYGRVVYYACLLSALHEQGELGAPAEDAISNFRKLGLKPKLTQNLLRGFWVNQAYFRVAQCLADHLAGRTLRLESLRDAIRELKEAEFTDLVRCNRLVAEAALLLFEAKHETALKRLTQAERLAAKPEVDCALAIFEIARLRAHLFTWMKNPRALHEARFALELAIEQGWVNRQRWIESEFGIKAATAGLPSPSASISSGSITLKRHLDSLLRVSLTAGTVLDPQLQAKAVLDEIVELLGAERGFLFLVNEKTGNLEMRAGRSSEKTDLEELKGYSSTVVNKVHQDRKTIVVTGTEEGAVLGSQSAVIHGLKSIMAAPLLLKDSALGVVYLDSRVAKGIFTSDDVEILAALSNHLAIALEIARNTRLEMERQALKKDLEITGAVQALLLPRETVFRNAHLKLAGFYRSASQSGGDWWCHQELPDGAVRILMGDVTGHGAGPAMVTAIAAATHESASRFAGHSTAPEVLRALHENLARLCRGSYLMTMGAVEISPAERRVRFWTAGAPPVFLVTPGAVNVKTLIERGTPLGSTEFNIGHVEAEFSPGDRLFLFTDCAYEMHVGESGKTLGMRQLSKLFLKLSTETPRSEVETLRGRLTETFDATLGNVPQDDDLTFVVVEHT